MSAGGRRLGKPGVFSLGSRGLEPSHLLAETADGSSGQWAPGSEVPEVAFVLRILSNLSSIFDRAAVVNLAPTLKTSRE